MATSIHHGPPGSFKSFTLVQRFAIDALKQGRVVITNIRGFTSIDRIKDQFPDDKIPESADLLFVNTEVEEGRRLMACWFHWVPLRALVIIDEGQRIYPDRRDFKLESLDQKSIPPGFQVDEIEIEINDEYTGQRYIVRRPEDVFTAFDMQRHFQWDVFISTPNIAKIKDPIREVSETAYRHKSLSGKLPKPLAKLFGLYNSWYEFQHDPENAGKLASQIIGKPRKYHADERIFRCYQSTATGEHTESQADQTILGDPKLKLLALCLVLAIGTVFYTLANRPKSHSSSALPAVQDDKKPASKSLEPSKGSSGSIAYVASGHGADVKAVRFFDNLGYKLLAISYQRFSDLQHKSLTFLADSQDGLKTVSFFDLYRAGVGVTVQSLCKITLIGPDGYNLQLTCNSDQISACSASVDSPDLVSRRNCRKYGEPKQTPVPELPQNALVATASNLMPSAR
jgi:zona occludens toxin